MQGIRLTRALHADMKDKHRSELEASKRDFQKRIDAAKKESIQQLKRQTSNTVTADLQHKLDVQTAEVRTHTHTKTHLGHCYLF